MKYSYAFLSVLFGSLILFNGPILIAQDSFNPGTELELLNSELSAALKVKPGGLYSRAVKLRLHSQRYEELLRISSNLQSIEHRIQGQRDTGVTQTDYTQQLTALRKQIGVELIKARANVAEYGGRNAVEQFDSVGVAMDTGQVASISAGAAETMAKISNGLEKIGAAVSQSRAEQISANYNAIRSIHQVEAKLDAIKEDAHDKEEKKLIKKDVEVEILTTDYQPDYIQESTSEKNILNRLGDERALYSNLTKQGLGGTLQFFRTGTYSMVYDRAQHYRLLSFNRSEPMGGPEKIHVLALNTDNNVVSARGFDDKGGKGISEPKIQQTLPIDIRNQFNGDAVHDLKVIKKYVQDNIQYDAGSPPMREAFDSYLRESAKEGSPESEQGFADFILKVGRGDCDLQNYVVTKLVREHLGLQARLATGYVGIDSDGKATISMHAWSEVYIPEKGWTVLDATGLADKIGTKTRPSLESGSGVPAEGFRAQSFQELLDRQGRQPSGYPTFGSDGAGSNLSKAELSDGSLGAPPGANAKWGTKPELLDFFDMSERRP